MLQSSSKKKQTKKTIIHHIDGLYIGLKSVLQDSGKRGQINKATGILSILLILATSLVGIWQGLTNTSAKGDKTANLYATICNGDPKNTVLTANASEVDNAPTTQVKSKLIPERNFGSFGKVGTAVYKEGSKLSCAGPQNTKVLLTPEIKAENQFRFANIKFSINKNKISEIQTESTTPSKSQNHKQTYFDEMNEFFQDTSIGDGDISAAWTSRASIQWTLDGKNWQNLAELSEIDQNPFEYQAPFLKDWNDLDDLQIKFRGAYKDQDYIYQGFEELWVEVTYREPE
ncbi:MAG: hypothetical protein ABH837_00825, partial [bacterium]